MIYTAVLAMTLMGALGAFFLKTGMDRSHGLASLLRNPRLCLGGCFYLAGAILNILLLRRLEYSVLYPMTAITYVWSMLLSAGFLKERLTGRKLIGVAAVLGGVFLLSR